MLHPRSRRRVSPLATILVGLAVVGFLLSSASIPHSHHPGRPGLYNQEHDLSYLAALGGAAAVPDAPSAAPVVLVAVLVLAAAFAVVPLPWRRHANFRAPPQR